MKPIFTRRNVIGTIIIIMAAFLCVIVTAFGLFAQCVTNYTRIMPVYAAAELVESESSLLNYIGMGNLQTVWRVSDDSEVVRQWYAEILNDQRRAVREAQRNNADAPPEWRGNVRVERVDDETRINMEANCF